MQAFKRFEEGGHSLSVDGGLFQQNPIELAEPKTVVSTVLNSREPVTLGY